MDLTKASKIALDESRLLILGAQVLMGFQFQVLFREPFEKLPPASRMICGANMLLMALSVGILIAPSMQHQIVESGFDSRRLLSAARRYAAASLVPLAAALDGDAYVTTQSIGVAHPLWASGAVLGLAGLIWVATPKAIHVILRTTHPNIDMKPTPLEARVDQMLTEARVILPGAQALLGFQLIAVFTATFEKLPGGVKTAHLFALAAVMAAIMVLMTVPIIHHVAFHGADDERFLKIGTVLLLVAPIFLACGMVIDGYIGLTVAGMAAAGAFGASAGLLMVLGALWYGWPLWLRGRKQGG